MKTFLDPPITARNGHKVRVLIICRVSKPDDDYETAGQTRKYSRKKRQTIQSNSDQAATFQRWIEDRTDLECEFVVVAGSGSGELLDRDESAKIEELIATGTFDIVIAEDLGRIYRRVHAMIFCEFCLDHDTRVIAPNDSVDTARDDWKLAGYFAVMRHESYNADTARRIRRTLRERFTAGGIVQILVPGYLKPDGEEIHDSQVSKDPAWEPIYDTWFRMLDEGASLSEVADWLNAQGLKTGRGNRWTCSSVCRVTYNPILKGIRQRNVKKTKRVNMTGRRKSVRADAAELLTRECPHLAFIEPARYDRVLRLLKNRNGKFARKKVNGADPRQNKPRKRTTWPAQHVTCGICGRLFVYGANGQPSHLGCSGAKDYTCWNGVSFDAKLGGKKLVAAILEKIEGLPEFDAELMNNMVASLQAAQRSRATAAQSLDQRQRSLEGQRDRIVEAIAASGGSDSLLNKLKEIEAGLADISQERHVVEQELPDDLAELPSIEILKTRAREVFAQLAFEDPAFQRQLKTLIPAIAVFPYRLIDDQKPVLRARVQLNLAPLVWDTVRGIELPVMQHELVVDLFDPPERAYYREQVIELRRSLTEKEVAAKLDITTTAAQRAAALNREMLKAGRTDPYIPVRTPSSELSRMRRHLHPRFRFEPLPGHEMPKFPTE